MTQAESGRATEKPAAVEGIFHGDAARHASRTPRAGDVRAADRRVLAGWYVGYGGGPGAWGLSPMQDQQLAGLVMWIPASGVYLVGALYTFRRWLRASEWSVAQRERATFA